MKVEKLSAFAEIVSSIAIVVTLIYLAIQSQQTSAALMANSRETTLMADMTLISALISNPEVMENSERPFDELTVAEREQLGNALAGALRSREFAWLQFQSGILDRPTFDSYMETPVRWIRDAEVFEFYWELFSPGINPDFRNLVDTLLEDSR